MNLAEIRKEIDHVDLRILKLLNERMERVLIANKFKAAIDDPNREKNILDGVRRHSGMILEPRSCEILFKEIMKISKRLQAKDHRLIAFRGEHGNYNELAATQWKDNLIPIPCREYEDVFEGISSMYYDYGIVPMENTLDGYVGPSVDLLMGTNLFAADSVQMPIHHCLLAIPGTDHREIRIVYSHPHILSQCRRFLSRNKLVPKPYHDSGAAAKWLAEEAPGDSAVISSKFAANLYNLEILKENIEDIKANKTRFLVFSRNKNQKPNSKNSIIISTDDKTTTLLRILECFVKEGVNLTSVESIPRQLGKHTFMLDFIDSGKDGKVSKVINRVKKMTIDFKYLGSYNEVEVVESN
ncbi:MAG: prephenate dehydratase domain-containing protein [Pseudomonadota bacterium]